MRALLAVPWIYDLSQFAMRGTGYRRRLADRHIRARAGDRVLDVGCGTAAILGCLPEVTYVGLDMSEEYLGACRRHWGSRGEFHRKELTGTTADVFGEFDIILALGLVHHLDDEQAKNLFAIARRTLRPGGRMITLDGVFAPQQSPLVRTLLRWDRGQHVRDEPAYRALAESASLKVTAHAANDIFRIPYDVLIMECVA